MSVTSAAHKGHERADTDDDAVALATALARPTLDETARAAISRLAPEVEANEVLTAAHHLGVGPLVASHLTDADVPAAFESRARERCRATGVRNLSFVAELHRVLSAFADAGLRCLVYKGPALAVSAYGDLSRRDFSDLDLFVPPEDVPEACATLESLGYNPWSENGTAVTDAESLVSRAAERTYFRPSEDTAERTVATRRPPSVGVAVELRWQLGTDLRPSWLTFDTAWERRTEVLVGGRPVPTFSNEDTVLVLARHGAKHYWNRLGWVVDVAAFLSENDIDWDRLRARAARVNRRRILHACLLLAAETADAPVPAEILADARADSNVRRVVIDAQEFVASNPETAAYGERGRRRRTRYELQLCDTRRQQVLTLCRLAFVPQQADYAAVSLPDSLHGLYRVTRPARLAVKALRRRVEPR
ncbi:nucleotidyltransferase family protein [Halogeometricum borinquense]|uniref:Nucleotidyltransferase family protein n=1 Tax=Halogeometricum borinquense TaxID=60847 RepID=A0A6C0UHF7_9EURY|nr:nucleotidyltransferase family protein [Halogeometricum borinquense]QIB74922.1 nucleotidyltransferase family protein [Halogeometricum borinquense]QIQ76078.1 nucleotidyltransferase family protein [Halogeometricum borinquense]